MEKLGGAKRQQREVEGLEKNSLEKLNRSAVLFAGLGRCSKLVNVLSSQFSFLLSSSPGVLTLSEMHRPYLCVPRTIEIQ